MASRSWNRIELIGNLTRDPELRYTPNGAAVATFGLATNRTYVVEGERKEDVDFHRVVAWNKLAELCSQLLKKGTKAFISGRLQYREWEGQDGVKHRDAEIVLEDMIVLSPKSEGYVNEDVSAESVSKVFTSEDVTPVGPKEEGPKEEAPTEEKKAAKSEVNEDINTDDLPF